MDDFADKCRDLRRLLETVDRNPFQLTDHVLVNELQRICREMGALALPVVRYNKDQNVRLSDAFLHTFEVDGIAYKSMKHFVHAMKSDKPAEQAKIRASVDPATESKHIITALNASWWETVRDSVVFAGLQHHFAQDRVFQRLLVSTQGTQLQCTEDVQGVVTVNPNLY